MRTFNTVEEIRAYFDGKRSMLDLLPWDTKRAQERDIDQDERLSIRALGRTQIATQRREVGSFTVAVR